MFDLYALSSNEGKGSIRAVLNYDAEKIVSEIKAKTTQAEFCRNLGITYMTFWDYLNRSSSIPLFVLQEYEKLTGKSLQKYIKNLECGIGDSKRRTTAVKSLSEDLTKIIGAFIADGHMKERSSQWNNRNATHYEIVFREEHKTNAQALSSWIYNIFNMKINPVKQDNHYLIYISNKIIFRYFRSIFGFSSGRKTETVHVPDLIKKSSKKIITCLIRGILMFDGSVSHRNGYIELYSKSKDLISDLATLLTKIDLKPDFISQKADKLGRHRLIIRKREKLKRSLCLFEPNTHKWFILKEHVSGLTTEASDYDEFIRAFKTHYPKLVSDMIRIIYSFQKEGMAPDFGLISEKLGRKSTVTYEFLSKLERWGILESTKQMNKKYWIVKSFLIPDRGDEYGKR